MTIPHKTLKNGFSMPALGLGTWLMGGNADRIPSDKDETDIAAIQSAIDLGYMHLDTAESYAAGYSEELLGRAIKGCHRDKLFIASKATMGNHTTKLLNQSLDASLQRLGLDYLNLYYLHRPTVETPFAETAAALNEAVKDGRIKHIGVCNFSPENVDKLQSYLDTPIVANQVHYNLAFREPELVGMFDHAVEKDYFVMAWRPLRLVRTNSGTGLEKNIWDRGVFPLLDQMADKYNKSNVQIALNWTVHHPHALTLIKSSRPQHLQEALGAFEYQLDEADYRILQRDFTPTFKASDAVALI